MPELPEVETVVRYLRGKILNQSINKINFTFTGVLKNSTQEKFTKFLVKETFLSIDRKGKYLIFHLTNNKTLVIHLRMEGKLFAQQLESKPNFKQLICEFVLDNLVLRYYDTRKFGTFEIIATNKLNTLKSLNKLAMDANTNKFTAKYLFEISRKSKIAIKTFLLDQTNVAGIGNIYVNEILFCCKLHPTLQTHLITLQDCENITKFSKKILNKSIDNNGTTIHSYKFNEYDSGGFQNFLLVHGRKNESCYTCKNQIEFIKVNGRGTYLCSKCQALPK